MFGTLIRCCVRIRSHVGTRWARIVVDLQSFTRTRVLALREMPSSARGVAATEYSLMLIGIVALIAVAINRFGDALADVFDRVRIQILS